MSSPLFVLGVPRSGTTLLRVMLAGHPQLFSPPEMILAPFSTMAERKSALDVRFWEKGGLRRTLMELLGLEVEAARQQEEAFEGLTVPAVYAWLQERLGERILVDKCPHLAGDPTALARLPEWFPDARYLWIVRHPGSVIRSLENMPMAEVMLTGFEGGGAGIWTGGNRLFQSFLSKIPSERWIMLRYEDLVQQPEVELRRFCEKMGLPYAPEMANPYEGDRMREGPKGARAVGDPNMAGRGKIDASLSTAWLEGFDPTVLSEDSRALSAELGYDLGQLAPPPIAAVTQAMHQFWDSLKTLEANLKVPQDLDAIEGRRFLLRVSAGALDTFVEWGDVDHPHFEHSEGHHRKTFGDCPDADYLRAPIRSDQGRIYRVQGRVPPGTTYVGMLLYRRGGLIGNRLRDVDFVGPDGQFDVVIATQDPQIPGTCFLKADGDELSVMVRQYFVNRQSQLPIQLQITLQGHQAPPPPLRAQELAKGVERARRMVEATLERTLATWRFASTGALNRFLSIGAETLFPTPDNDYQACWYRFGRDQVMLVRGRIPAGRYFSFTLYNAWLESLDYRYRPVHRNHTQIPVDAEGNFEICLAHRDPGHAAWLDTAGHLAGYLVARSLLKSADIPEFTIQVMYEKEWEAEKLRRATQS